MRNKCYILSVSAFIISVGIFVLTYFLYHYMGADGRFTAEFLTTPGKPSVTLLFGIWGVIFLFVSWMCALVGTIFFWKK